MSYFNTEAPLNEEVRYDHGNDCLKYGATSPDTRGRFYVKRTTGKWVYSCKNCGFSGARLVPLTSERIRAYYSKTPVEKTTQSRIKEYYIDQLPEGNTNTAVIYRYLAEKGINIPQEDIYSSGLRITATNHLVLPFRGRGFACYNGYQLKYIGKLKSTKRAKYLTFKARDVDVVYNFIPGPNIGSSSIVIVEDILSSIVVSRYCNVIALLGSPKKLPDEITRILSTFSHTYVWLDPDMKGKMLKIQKALGMQGISSSVIMSDKDPKETPDKNMRRYLEIDEYA